MDLQSTPSSAPKSAVVRRRRKTWPPNRIAALLLTLGLAALALYTWLAGSSDRKTLLLLGVGVLLGLIYTVRGGSLPAWIYNVSQSHWVGGTGITADRDPGNLSPRLYLSILLIVLLLAAGICYYELAMRH